MLARDEELSGSSKVLSAESVLLNCRLIRLYYSYVFDVHRFSCLTRAQKKKNIYSPRYRNPDIGIRTPDIQYRDERGLQLDHDALTPVNHG